MDKNLTLFTNTYPYGSGETFLDCEIVYLSKQFNHINIFPLYAPDNNIKNRNIGNLENVTVNSPLIQFDHNDKLELFKNGLYGLTNIRQIKEYI